VSPVRYELAFYIPEDDILHSHCRENLKCYITLTGWTLSRRRNVSPVKYELIFISEDGILNSHRREHLKSYTVTITFGSIHPPTCAVLNAFTGRNTSEPYREFCSW
jgi:hypothetical protein